MIYVQIRDGVVVNRAVFDGAMPQDWPDRASWRADESAQIGWILDGVELVPPQQEQPPIVPPSGSRLNPKLDMGGSIADIIGSE